MMATTHAFMSLTAAIIVLPALSGYASTPLLLGAAFVGGLAPDLDVAGHHRKTLHYPFLGPVLATALFSFAVATSSGPAMVVAVAVAGGALHAVTDIFGGSPEREPWNPSSDRAVYNHLLGRWHPAKRYVRYSGAPEDWLVGVAFATAAILSATTPVSVDLVLLCLLGATGVYTLFRKRLRYLLRVLESLLPVRSPAVAPVVDTDDDPD